MTTPENTVNGGSTAAVVDVSSPASADEVVITDEVVMTDEVVGAAVDGSTVVSGGGVVGGIAVAGIDVSGEPVVGGEDGRVVLSTVPGVEAGTM